jgi:hypothetical protein
LSLPVNENAAVVDVVGFVGWLVIDVFGGVVSAGGGGGGGGGVEPESESAYSETI